MDISALQHAAAGNDWGAIWPELAVGCLALAFLMIDVVLPRRAWTLVPNLALLGQAAILVGMALQGHSMAVGETFNGLLRLGRIAVAMRFFFVLSSIFVCLLARVYFGSRGALVRGDPPGQARVEAVMPPVEFYSVILVAAASMMLLAESNHLLMLFVALETVTVGFYILVSYNRASALTLEAGLKVPDHGRAQLRSAPFRDRPALRGGGKSASARPYRRRNALPGPGPFPRRQSPQLSRQPRHRLRPGRARIQGGRLPVSDLDPGRLPGRSHADAAYLAVASKAAGFAVLLGLVRYVFGAYDWLVVPVLSWMAAATLIFGNLAARRPA